MTGARSQIPSAILLCITFNIIISFTQSQYVFVSLYATAGDIEYCPPIILILKANSMFIISPLEMSMITLRMGLDILAV